MESRNSNNCKGIDISNWQGNVNFAKVKSSGVQIVYMKASEGKSYRDKFLNQNYNGAKAQGLKVGFYHFFRGNTNAKSQARHFANCINGKNPDCRLALDIETTDGVGKSKLSSMCIEFLEEVKKITGRDVVVYTYTSFARTNIDSRLAKYPLWIAHYGVNTPGRNPIWNSWVGFQYTSKGRVNGVNGNCDMNEFTNGIFLDNTVISSNHNQNYDKHQIKVGDKVKIIGNNYATGQTIPQWVKSKNYTVQQISGDRALLKEITSWVYTRDLALVNAPSWINLDGKTGVCIGNGVRIRSSKSTNTNKNILGQLCKGDKVRLYKKEGDWIHIYYPPHGGYVYAKYIKY